MSMLFDLFAYDFVRARQRELLADADRMRMRAQARRPRRPPSTLRRLFHAANHTAPAAFVSRLARPSSVNAPVRVRTRPNKESHT